MRLYNRVRVVFVLVLLHFFFLTLWAQGEKENSIRVEKPQGHALEHAWTGGWNSPQFSAIDLNLDGRNDLFVFDREGERVMTFLNGGTAGTVDYTYAPEYEAHFPQMFYWALLADYNKDGKADIFTYNNGGIRVFKNTSTAAGVSFELVADPYLISHYDSHTSGNLYCSSQDLPAITDVDNDGDLDFLTFGSPSSQAVYFHENFAADSGDLESFKIYLNTYCWGNFEEDASTNSVTLNKGCPKSGSSSRHSGSTMLAFDTDGDGDKELVLGDISYTNLVLLTNGGTKFKANMLSQNAAFPNASDPVDLHLFPAAFHLDVNNDGLKDLLISPNAQYNIEDISGVWYYKNVGTTGNASFELVNKHFLQNEMMDVGSGAFPVFFDYNFNGTSDLVIGNNGRFNGASDAVSGLQLFHNTGSATSPVLALADERYAGLDTLPLNTTLNIPSYALIPAFGDLDGDGDPDMLVGDGHGRIHYFKNKPFSNYSHFELHEVNFKDIDVGQFAAPQLVDLDRDGLLDLVIGEQEGNLNYYRNTGSRQVPVFKLVTETLGQVNTKGGEYYGHSQPLFFRRGADYFLLCGAENGKIYYYSDIDDNLTGPFTLLDSFYLGIDAGRRSRPALADLDGDGHYELIVGNYGGGLTHYITEIAVGIDQPKGLSPEQWEIQLSQIEKHRIQVGIRGGNRDDLRGVIALRNVVGQQLLRLGFVENIAIDLSAFPAGMILVTVEHRGTYQTKKFILQH